MTDTEGVADPTLEAEGELSLARIALDEGDRWHAAEHVARALVCSPALPEVHELLATLVDPELFSMEPPVFLGEAVARAHLLAARGEEAEALEWLVSAQCAEPRSAWADVPWVRDAALPARLSPDDVVQLLNQLYGVMADPVAEDQRTMFAPYADFLENAIAAFPTAAGLLASASIFVRRMGDPERAADLAQRSMDIQPSFPAALALGYAYRSQGRIEDTERAWIRALDFDPGNLAVFTDLGELLDNNGRHDEGLAWVERALERDPREEGAFPTACGMRFRRDNDIAHLVALADYLREHPDNGYAEGVLARTSGSRYWLSEIPRTYESILNLLAQLPENSGAVSCTVTAPEPPSAFLAFSSVAPGSSIEVTDRPEPDAWLPVPDVFDEDEPKTLVWTPDGEPAVAPPAPESAAAVRDLATSQWRHLPQLFDDAVRLAGLPLPDLLGVMVHPPAPEDKTDWPRWLRAIQVAACLGIAHHLPDEPWRSSTRRKVLFELAFGPEDWVSEAALLAMVATAWVEPPARTDVAHVVAARFLAAVEAGCRRPVTIADTLALLVLATPQMPPKIAEFAVGYYQKD
ncbi:tetratricopeptide repeat protein [Fodinicola acaciae]|uniref:tetratricopeptide repeat protein n=1 Tax=Fodinicola acaciae TaxID=2681555 RepID=UPI0013D10996|nr:tetratricopeptide repeat protein [Fodinicola acaciae]